MESKNVGVCPLSRQRLKVAVFEPGACVQSGCTDHETSHHRAQVVLKTPYRIKQSAAELRSELPIGWADQPLILVKRSEHDDAVRSVYRVGPKADTRVMLVELDAKGKLMNVAIRADPDNRQSC